MTKKRMRAASTLFGCVLALASSACNNDKGGGPTDSGLPDAGDAALPDGGPDAGDGATPDGGDASVPQTAAIRLAHLAYGYGSGATLLVHVCLKYSAASDPTDAVLPPRILVTEARDAAHTPRPIPYGGVSAAVSIPPAPLNSTATKKATAEVWAADDITTAVASGVATCTPINGTVEPITSLVIPPAGSGGFVAGHAYTVMVTGHNDGQAVLPYTPTGACLNATASGPVACPTATIHVLSDDVTKTANTTTLRIVNASTTFTAQGSCSASVSGGDGETTPLTTGQSAPVIAGASAGVPLALPRPTIDPAVGTFASPFTALAADLAPTSPSPALLLGPILPTAGGPICPVELVGTTPASAPPDTSTGHSFANGSLPQSGTITGRLNPATTPGSASAVTGTTTANPDAAAAAAGSVVTLFIIDFPNPAAGMPNQTAFVPAQVLVRYDD